jgi:hypothetical protein
MDGFLWDAWDAAVHEAGHVIVGLATGRRLVEVTVSGEEGLVTFETWELRHPWAGGNVARLRRVLTMNVAGHVAEDLDHERMTWGGWAPHDLALARAIADAEGEKLDVWPYRTSSRIRRGDPGNGEPGSDVANTLERAQWVCEGRAGRPAGWPFTTRRDYNGPSDEEILAEVVRAEKRAERILKRDWDKVLKLAGSLCRRKSGRMTAAQVNRLLEGRGPLV